MSLGETDAPLTRANRLAAASRHVLSSRVSRSHWATLRRPSDVEEIPKGPEISVGILIRRRAEAVGKAEMEENDEALTPAGREGAGDTSTRKSLILWFFQVSSHLTHPPRLHST